MASAKQIRGLEGKKWGQEPVQAPPGRPGRPGAGCRSPLSVARSLFHGSLHGFLVREAIFAASRTPDDADLRTLREVVKLNEDDYGFRPVRIHLEDA